MRLVEIAEIKNIADYELERESWRPRIMALKDRRRIQVGGHMTFLFENRETVRYQVQEMMRIERIVRAQDVAHELETYNELIPGANELSASLLIEYVSQEERQIRLRELLGLERHVWLQIEGTAPRVPARFDTRQIAPIASARCSTSSFRCWKRTCATGEKAWCWPSTTRTTRPSGGSRTKSFGNWRKISSRRAAAV
jgi:hypothetical protein